MRTSTRPILTTLAVATALLVAAAPALAGPPWISVEYPTNPHHPTTRDASFLVRVYHHATSIEATLTGRAEGRVDGRRTTVPLTVEPTALAGVYSVTGLPRGKGDWVAVITMENGSATASAVVTLAPGGAVLAVDVPSDRTHDGWVVPRAVTAGDIDTGLRQAAALSAAYRTLGDSPEPPLGASLPLLLLVPVAAAVIGLRGARRSR